MRWNGYMRFLFLGWTDKDEEDCQKYIGCVGPVVIVCFMLIIGCLMIAMVAQK